MLTTRQVCEATGVHERTLDTWVRRGHLRAPRKRNGRLYWHPDTVVTCLARIEKRFETPKREPGALEAIEKELKLVTRQRDLALAWLVAKVIGAGTLPLADQMLRAHGPLRRIEEVLAQFDIALVEQRAGVLLLYPRKR